MYFEMLRIPSKTQPFLVEIFKYYDRFLDVQLETLAVMHMKAKGGTLVPKGLCINGSVYIMTCLSHNHLYENAYPFLDPSLQEEGNKFEGICKKCKEDMRYLNQWLSIAIDPLDKEITRKRLPDFIANLSEKYAYSHLKFCEIPKGKEAMWKKAEELAKYYLGYKLLV